MVKSDLQGAKWDPKWSPKSIKFDEKWYSKDASQKTTKHVCFSDPLDLPDWGSRTSESTIFTKSAFAILTPFWDHFCIIFGAILEPQPLQTYFFEVSKKKTHIFDSFFLRLFCDFGEFWGFHFESFRGFFAFLRVPDLHGATFGPQSIFPALREPLLDYFWGILGRYNISWFTMFPARIWSYLWRSLARCCKSWTAFGEKTMIRTTI